MKKLLALAMLLVLCTVLTGLLTGCKVSAANTMMVDDTPKVTVTSRTSLSSPRSGPSGNIPSASRTRRCCSPPDIRSPC